jgi:plasmid stabilization system protein ParE
LEFEVDITEPALMDAEDYVRFIRDIRKEPEAAERWFRGLVQAIYSLEAMPERCPIIPEQKAFAAMEIRHLVYFSHRIVFRVERERKRVVIYRVYHSSRKRFPGHPNIGDSVVTTLWRAAHCCPRQFWL